MPAFERPHSSLSPQTPQPSNAPCPLLFSLSLRPFPSTNPLLALASLSLMYSSGSVCCRHIHPLVDPIQSKPFNLNHSITAASSYASVSYSPDRHKEHGLHHFRSLSSPLIIHFWYLATHSRRATRGRGGKTIACARADPAVACVGGREGRRWQDKREGRRICTTLTEDE